MWDWEDAGEGVEGAGREGTVKRGDVIVGCEVGRQAVTSLKSNGMLSLFIMGTMVIAIAGAFWGLRYEELRNARCIGGKIYPFPGGL